MLKSSNSDATLIGLTATPFRREPRENVILDSIFPNYPVTPVDRDLVTYEDIRNAMVQERILAKQVNKTPAEYGIINNSTNITEQRGVTNRIVEALIRDGHESILVFCPSVEWSRLVQVLS